MLAVVAFCLMGHVSCTSSNDDFFPDDMFEEMPGGNGSMGSNGTMSNDGDVPSFGTAIAAWNGEKADDAHLDMVGTNTGFYHEANTFTHTVTVIYNKSEAAVESSNDQILCHTAGAYVTVDMMTNTVSNVNIILKGKSEDGGLKIYGGKKFKLTLDGVELVSRKGPAINSQCKKRIFVHLSEGTTNRLTDVAKYTEDAYYIDSLVFTQK